MEWGQTLTATGKMGRSFSRGMRLRNQPCPGTVRKTRVAAAMGPGGSQTGREELGGGVA